MADVLGLLRSFLRWDLFMFLLWRAVVLFLTVVVVDHGSGDGVVNVDGRGGEVVVFDHLVEPVDARDGVLHQSPQLLADGRKLFDQDVSRIASVVQHQVGLPIVTA